jgi:hypothetical protein
MFNTSSQSFQRQDDQEVDAISCFFPLQNKRNAHYKMTLSINVNMKRSFLVARDFDIKIFF